MPREGLFRSDRVGVHRYTLKYLVDANVLSEPTKPEPDPAVVEWLRKNESEIVVDPIILGEIRFRALLLPRGRRRRKLEAWFDEGVQRVLCLPWHATTGLKWAELLASLRASGQAMPIKDSLIASTALVHRLTVVTRNQTDFEKAGVDVLDPFSTNDI
ncbi:MAG TPA: PIN domain-containing protein [Vicinamibacteria bacterium]|nr:PIN domain-containing protein [Vicinamibacteria bacterium]